MTSTDASSANPQQSEFELRRADLVSQIGDSLEQVLTQINALNRSMESIIEIGNEFASVEALWSQFENVMGSNSELIGDDALLGQGHGDAEGSAEVSKS